MPLLALRPKYQLAADQGRNRVFYQNFEPMQFARALPARQLLSVGEALRFLDERRA